MHSPFSLTFPEAEPIEPSCGHRLPRGARALKAVVTILIPAALVACSSLRGDPEYGVCRAQIVDFVRERLGQSVVRMDLDYAERWPPRPRTPPETGRALVYVRECPGYHLFEVRGTEDTCEHVPHYGHRSGAYVVHEGGYDGCGR